MTEQEIKDAILQKLQENPKYGRASVCRDFGLTEFHAKRCLKELKDPTTPTTPTKKPIQKNMDNTKKRGLTMGEMRAKYDNMFIISTNAKKLKQGVFLTEAEFKQTCNFASNTGYADAIKHPDFSQYRGRAGGVIYWGHPESITEMKDDNILKDA